MHLQVRHDTIYHYHPVVETAHHVAHLRPRDTPAQRTLSHDLRIEPDPMAFHHCVDSHGNAQTHFELQVPHDRLLVSAISEVRTEAALPHDPADTPAWDALRDQLRYRAGQPYESASRYAFASPLAPRHPDFAAYARSSFAAGTPLLVAACDLMHRVHRDFTYSAQSTDVTTPAQESLRRREGVCQDFTHVVVACLRAMGLPARYVSGYLLTEPPAGMPRLIGADASHAWASVYVPPPAGRPGLADGAEARGFWVDLDPTNDRWGVGTPGEEYVTVAYGRDYGDVSPLRGVIHGGGRHTLEVAVTVLPQAEPAAATPATPQPPVAPQA